MTLNLPVYSGDELVGALKPFQQGLVSELLKEFDEETAAKMWLSSSGPLDLRQFGGEQKSSGEPFYQRFSAEFRTFVCGGERYEKERSELMRVVKPAASYVITVISVAVASVLGVAVGLIVPAVALLLKLIGKIGLNVWCDIPR